ncbi:unnamed protein product [Paramecium pentaurelia]|uniref:Uncharacterized protein n=1 Tax=Paramecium pentaurelia TaxID=43138 RepID=A0A8S1YL04_9CILI|nr:unnamed protein product [Paramecium pentaurelia]
MSQERFPGCIFYLSVTGKEKYELTETTSDQYGKQIEKTTTQTYTGLSQIYQYKVEIYNFENLIYTLYVNLYFIFNFQFYLIILVHIMKKLQPRYPTRLKLLFKLSNLPSILSNIVKSSQLWNHKENLKSIRVRLVCNFLKCCFRRKGVLKKNQIQAFQVQCFIDKFNFHSGDRITLNQINQCILYQQDYTIKGNQTSFNYRTKSSQLIEGVAANCKKQLNVKFFLKNNDPYNELLPSVNFKLIQSEYQLVIQANVDSDSCCKQYSSIIFLLRFQHLLFKATIQFQYEPPKRNPQVFQNQKVCLTDRNKYQKKNISQRILGYCYY